MWGRSAAALTNFAPHLPAEDVDLAKQLVRDRYIFDFVALTNRVAERGLEDALVANLHRSARARA